MIQTENKYALKTQTKQHPNEYALHWQSRIVKLV